jgi:hypothetical protein
MADYNSSLPVRTEADADIVAALGDGTTRVAVTTNNELSVYDAEVADNQTDGSQKTQIVDGDNSEVMTVNPDGSINVVLVEEAASAGEVHVYGTAVASAPETPQTIVDYIVPVDKTLRIRAIQGACSGKAKVELKTGTDGSETTKAVGFLSTSSGFAEIVFPQPIEVVAGDSVLLIVTNNDKQNADVYGFVNGSLV